MVFRLGKIATPYSRFFFGKRNLFQQSLGLGNLYIGVTTLLNI